MVNSNCVGAFTFHGCQKYCFLSHVRHYYNPRKSCAHVDDLLNLRLQGCAENGAFWLQLVCFTSTHARIVTDASSDAAALGIVSSFEHEFTLHYLLFKQKFCYELGCAAHFLYAMDRLLIPRLKFNSCCCLSGVDMLPRNSRSIRLMFLYSGLTSIKLLNHENRFRFNCFF